MADEFDEFEDDFGEVAEEDFEPEEPSEEGRQEQEREKKEIKSIPDFIKAVVEHKYFKFALIAIGVIILIIVTTIIIGALSQPSVYEEEIKTPFYYSLPLYRFKLDEEITINRNEENNTDLFRAPEVRVPYILLKLELVFDLKYKDKYVESLEQAKYQIQNFVVNTFKDEMTYEELNNNAKRQEVYEESREYINRILEQPIIKEILEIRFEASLMKRRIE
ncbi:MAG: hypothetical protein ACOCV8_01405 [Spirochaetota bacterium]